MLQPDFIFSDRPQLRLARHTCFWLVWWIYFVLTYYFPHFWFVNWNVNSSQFELTRQIGYWPFTQFVVANTFMGSISTQMVFTYVVIGLLAPRFLYKRKYLLFGLSVFGLTWFVGILTYYKFEWYYNPLLSHFGLPLYEGSFSFTWYCIWTQVLFNCPTTAGLALAITMFKYYYIKDRETRQALQAKAKAELQVLKAQIHPHFLFNTINSIYFLTLTAPAKATRLILRLSGLLRYMLQECNHRLVPLNTELNYIQDYIGLEKTRYEDKLKVEFAIEGDCHGKWISPLLLIPLVENSFKHGVSGMLSKSWVSLRARVDDGTLFFWIANSKPVGEVDSLHVGIGLINLKKRLAMLSNERNDLRISQDMHSYSVFLTVKLSVFHQMEQPV